jgi:hypothetical protein
MDSPRLNAFFRFKDDPNRGGIIENASMRNVDVGSVASGGTAAGILIQYTYSAKTGPYTPVLRNINISDVRGGNIPKLVILQAGATAIIENFTVRDSVFAGPDPAELKANPGRITFTNVSLLPRGATLPARAGKL